MALALVGIVGGLAVLIVSYNAPSGIPRQPGVPGRPFFVLNYVRDFALRCGSLLPMADSVLAGLAIAGTYDNLPPVRFALAVLFFAVWAWMFGPIQNVARPAPARLNWQENVLVPIVWTDER